MSYVHWAQSGGAVEFTDCIFTEGYDSLNEFPGYDTKQSDDEAPVMQELWEMQGTLHYYHSQVHSASE